MNQTASVIEPLVEGYRPPSGDGEEPRPLRRPLPSPEPFPVDVLGDVLAGAVHAIHDRVQAPLALCAQSVLATATLAVQAHADVEMPGGRRKPVSEFFLTIAESGERKTSADDEAKWCIRRREEVLKDGYSDALLDWQNSKAAWESSRRSITSSSEFATVAERKAALADLGPEPEPPQAPAIECDDPTPEGLIKLLRFGQPSIGIFTSEGGRFIGSHAMNEDNRVRTATTLSAMWDGASIKRVRQGDDLTLLYGRRLAMHLMIQPVLAPRLLSDEMLVGQGLLSRTLVVAPESTAGSRFYREPSPDSEAALRRFGARCLDAMEKPPALREGTTNELEPRALPMASDAAAAWVSFSDHVERQLDPDGPLAPIRGWASKQAEHAARLAGVVALVEDINISEIELRHIEAGIALSEHYATESLRLYMAGHDDPLLLLAEKALGWIRAEWPRIQQENGFEPLGYVSLPDIYQLGPNAIRSAKKAREVMNVLEAHGWVTKQEGGAEVLGVQRRDVWLLTAEG